MSLTNLYITKATPFEWKVNKLSSFKKYYPIHNLVILVFITILRQMNVIFKHSDRVNFLQCCAYAKKRTFTRIKSLWLNMFSWNYFAPKHIGNPTAGLWKMRWANAVCDFAFPLCVYLQMLVVYRLPSIQNQEEFLCFMSVSITNYEVY